MNKKDLLKLAKERVDELLRSQKEQEQEETHDVEATKLALLLESNQSIVEAVERGYFDTKAFSDAVTNAVSQLKIEIPKIDAPSVSVNVPDVHVPEIVLPQFNFPEIVIPPIVVPEPKVTVNVPEQKAPIVNVEAPIVNFPDKMDATLEYTKKNPLPVISVDPAGNFVSPVAGGSGGPRRVKIDNNASEPIPISGTISATFSADFGSGEIGGQTLRVVQATDAISSVNIVGGSISTTPGATFYASDAVGSVNVIQSIPLEVTQISGHAWSTYITGATGTIGVVTINPDGLPVYGGTSSGGGLTDAELRASSVPVEQVSGSIWSTSVIGTVPVSGTFFQATQPVSVANTLDVQQVSGASWSTNVLSMPAVVVTSITNSIATSILNGDGTTLDPRNRNWTITETVPISSANTLDVKQVSGASDSVNVLSMPAVVVTSITNSTAVTVLNGEGVARDTWGSSQVGTWNITTLTGITNTVAVANIDSSGVQYSGSNPFPISGTVVVSSITASTASALIDSTGVQYSGSNPVPTKEIKPATGTNSSVADNAASTTILASNTARIGATVYNDSSATLYLLLGSTAASTTNYTCRVASMGYYEVPFGYTGQLTGIWATDPGDGAARVTEIT